VCNSPQTQLLDSIRPQLLQFSKGRSSVADHDYLLPNTPRTTNSPGNGDGFELPINTSP
jgi:hypothetical protein